MSRIVWGDPDNRLYETGIDRGVFYPQGSTGVPWSGLIAVDEAPSGADIRQAHYDGQMFRQERRHESFAAKISAITFPREFAEYDGLVSAGHKQQIRKTFGLSYRTSVTNALGGTSHLIHLVYNATVSPSQIDFRSLGGSPNASAFNWDLNTVPEILPDGSSSAHLIINTALAYPWAVTALESVLYGDDTGDSRFPSIFEVLDIFENASLLRIIDHGDGTWTAEGPDEAIEIIKTPWVEKRRNLFGDPLAKTTNSVYWGSTAGAPTLITDPDGTEWIRFTRTLTGPIRLVDIKVGATLPSNSLHRFVFTLRSSTTRIITPHIRPDVTNSAITKVVSNQLLEAGVPTRIEFGTNTHTNASTANAGVTFVHDSTNIGETLDIRMVDIEGFWEFPGFGAPVLFGVTEQEEDWRQIRWLGAANASPTVLEECEVSFEITWPSVVYIDTDTYQISSL